MLSADLYIRLVFAVTGKTDTWEMQMLTATYLINTKYYEMRETKQSMKNKRPQYKCKSPVWSHNLHSFH